MRDLRLRMLSNLFKLRQLGRGFKCRFVRLWCLFSFRYACLGLKDLSWIFVSLWCCAWNSLGLKCPCPSNPSRMVILPPRQEVFRCLSALISLHMCIVLQVNALWSSPPEPLFLGQRNPVCYSSLSPLLSQFFISSPITCLPWVLHKYFWNSKCLNTGSHKYWRS